MATWLVVAGAREGAAVEGYLKACDHGARVRVIDDPVRVREALRSAPGRACVVVGEGARGPEPINVAAALVCDGCAAEVMLVVSHASGSLRSRAKRAGITRVFAMSEVAAVGGARVEPGGASRPPSAGPVARPGVAAVEKGASGGLGDGRATGLAEGLQREVAPGGSPPLGGRPAPAAVAKAGCGAGGDLGLAGLAGASAPPMERKADVPVICFVSGRGGVGKTTACALSGVLAASWGMRVAMLDLDLAFGNLHALCGLERPADLGVLVGEDGAARGLPGADEIDACGLEVGPRLSVWGPCALPEYAELVQPLAERLIARLTCGHDLVLVDTTTNWGDAVASAAQCCDRLVIVSDERPGALPALSRCGSLAVRLGVARTRIVRLMNCCDPRGRDESYVARAARGLECAREVRVLDGGIDAHELLDAGKASELAAADGVLASSLATGLAQLLRELGCLPACEAAQRAAEGRRRARHFLGLGREAV